MSLVHHSYDIKFGVTASHLVEELAWSMLMLPLVLFAWHQSNFQYDIYMPGDYGLLIYRLSVASVVVLTATTLLGNYPRPFVYMVLGFILLAAFHGILDVVTINEGKPRSFLETTAFALMMLPIVSNKRTLYRFIRVNFVLGMMLVILNTIPVLHWLDIVSLPNEQVTRFGGDTDLPELDPLHFGIFGLTESFPAFGHPLGIARLQGFSLEPISWAYFVFLTIASGLFLLSTKKKSKYRIGPMLIAGVIAVHLFFVYSVTAFLVVAAWIGILAFFFIMRKFHNNENREVLYGFIFLIVVPGLLIPFLMAQIPGIDVYLDAGNILNKEGNWEDKIGFITLGSSLYTRFLPTIGETPAAGHNLILATYLKYGYILSLPLFAYFWVFMKRAFGGMSFAILAGTAITILAHTILVPSLLFYPSGVMWIMIAIGTTYHAKRTENQLARAPSTTFTEFTNKRHSLHELFTTIRGFAANLRQVVVTTKVALARLVGTG